MQITKLAREIILIHIQKIRPGRMTIQPDYGSSRHRERIIRLSRDFIHGACSLSCKRTRHVYVKRGRSSRLRDKQLTRYNRERKLFSPIFHGRSTIRDVRWMLSSRSRLREQGNSIRTPIRNGKMCARNVDSRNERTREKGTER